MLAPQNRLKVAEACRPSDKWSLTVGESVVSLTPKGFVERYWSPEVTDLHYRALVTKIAELIEGVIGNDRLAPLPLKLIFLLRFNKALSTGSVGDLERLAWELITGESV